MMRRGRPSRRYGFVPSLALAWFMTGLIAYAKAQDPTPTPPVPSPAAEAPPTPPPSVEAQLRAQQEMIQRLAEQNQKLSEQLDRLSKRLDAVGPEGPSAPTPPAAPVTPRDLLIGEPPAPPTPSATPPSSSGPHLVVSEPPATAPPLVSREQAANHGHKGLVDSLHHDDDYGLKSLFDSLHPDGGKRTPWYEKLSIRGYTQFRFGRSLAADGIDPDLLGSEDPTGANPNLLGDRSINGSAENFSIRRARLILFGSVSDHLDLYFQSDFANTPPGSTSATFFAQLRDLYGDVYLDKTKINRFRVGLSKVPFGFENMQSSQNRVPLDRTDAINTAVSPNERDLGVFYYWTPVAKQKLFKDLVDGGLKGSGNYGIFAFGAYNGQGGSQLEKNLNLYMVARLTYPWVMPSGQVMEASIQAYGGDYVVQGAKIRALGKGKAIVPEGTDGTSGLRDQRIGATFVYYPQPFGFQAEWNVGEGPGLNEAQTAVDVRAASGGYLMAMYKYDNKKRGIFTPYARFQHYQGGYRSVPNAPFGYHDQWDLGIEWQIRKEMELVVEYSLVDGVNLNSSDDAGFLSYRNFNGSVLRTQFQINY